MKERDCNYGDWVVPQSPDLPAEEPKKPKLSKVSPRGAWGVRVANVKTQNPKGWKPEAPKARGRSKLKSQLHKREPVSPSSAGLLFGPSVIKRMISSHVGEDHRFHLVCQLKRNFYSGNALPQTPRNNILSPCWGIHQPVTWIDKNFHNILSIKVITGQLLS